MSGKKLNYSEKEYAELGKMLVEFQAKGIQPGKGFYKPAFFKGIIGGFGGVIGATLLITLFLWFLQLFDSFPFIGRFVDTVKNSLSN